MYYAGSLVASSYYVPPRVVSPYIAAIGYPHIVTNIDKSFVIFYATNPNGETFRSVYSKKYNLTSGGNGYGPESRKRVGVSKIDPGAKFYSAKVYTKENFWLVWQDQTADNIYGRRFDKDGAPAGVETVLLTHGPGTLELYGVSCSAVLSSQELYVTYKESGPGF
jgi:hypothetical protein